MIRPTKHRRTGIYLLRKAAPVALRPTFGGAWEVIENLKTKDPDEARKLAPAAMDRIEAKFKAARAHSQGKKTALTSREVAAFVGEIYRKAAVEIERDPGEVHDWEAHLNALNDAVPGPVLGEVATEAEHGDERAFSPGGLELASAKALLASQGIAADDVTVRSGRSVGRSGDGCR